MTLREHLLTCLIEECAEVQKAVSKALRFGLDDGYPKSGRTNRQDIEEELLDVLSVMWILADKGIIRQFHQTEIDAALMDKRDKVETWLKYARSRMAMAEEKG